LRQERKWALLSKFPSPTAASPKCFFKRYFDLTDVCPLLTKQYIQVGLQIQYMFLQFLDGLSLQIWYGYEFLSSDLWAPILMKNQSTINAHQFINQLDHRSITKWTNVHAEICAGVLHDRECSTNNWRFTQMFEKYYAKYLSQTYLWMEPNKCGFCLTTLTAPGKVPSEQEMT
jgi:hypothetical protein